MKGRMALGIVVAALVIIAGAGVIYYTETLGNTVHKGKLNITSIADSGESNVSWIFATFSKVMINSNQTNWQTFSLQNLTVNILENATKAPLLCNIALNSHAYNEVKLYMNSVVVGINGRNTTFNLSQNYALSSHIFHILSHQNTMLFFDFNTTQDLNWTTHTFTPSAVIHSSS